MAKKTIKEADEERVAWGRPIEFLLTLAAYNVGPGNILRFPYLCMRNGGAAFLVPYFVCLFVCGVPLFLLEIVMGQSTRTTCIGCWNRYGPFLKGVGYSMVALAAVQQFEFQTYYAWILYYLARSFTMELPWTTCGNEWNTPSCVPTTGNESYTSRLLNNASLVHANGTVELIIPEANYTRPMTAVEEYFQNHVLELSEGIDDTGGMRWQLIVCHLVGWVILAICLFRGIKSTGKIVWVAATLPYLLITIFIIRAAMLPGFMDGINLYLTPDFEKLKNPEVWMMGFLQIFYSLGPGWGGVITVSSHNDYNHNFLIEAVANPIICCLSSFYGGFITFGAAGFLAYKSGLPVEKAMKSGPGIAFVSYPELAAHLPGGPIWSVLFFLMILNVTLGTLLVMIETCLSALVELFGLKQRSYKWVLLVYAIVNMVLGLMFFTRSGMYIFQFIDWYFAAIVVFFTAGGECLTVCWIYGYENIFNDIHSMIGRRPQKWLMVPLWGVFIPLLMLLGMIWSIATLPKPKYGDYEFPDWTVEVGWAIAVSLLAPALMYSLYRLIAIRGAGFWERFKLELWPVRIQPTGEDEMCELNGAPEVTDLNELNGVKE